MISGSCPYKGCEGRVWEAIADLPLPKYQKHKCEECKRIIWTKHSRVDPCSWTSQGFHSQFKVKGKKIEPRKKPKKLTKKELLFKEVYESVMRKAIREHLIFGTGIFKVPNHGMPIKKS